LHEGRFPNLCVLLRFGNTLGLMPSDAPQGHTGTSLTTNNFSSQSFGLLIKPLQEQHEWKQCQVRRSRSDHRPDFGGLGWDQSSGVIRANSFEGFSVFFFPLGGGLPLPLTYSEMLPITKRKILHKMLKI